MEKKRYVVELLDLVIGLRSHDSKEYIDELAGYVNRLLNGFKSNSANISNLELYALSALSIADELFKERKKTEELRSEIEGVKKELSDSLGRHMMLEAELHEARLYQDGLKEDRVRLEKTLKDDGDREERLKETLNILSYELKKPHGDRVYEKEFNEAVKLLEEMIRVKKEAPEETPRTEDERQLSLYDVMEE